MQEAQSLIIGIDATNLRRGGGVTHLVELLQATQPDECGFLKVVIWAGETTLRLVDDKPWIIKRNPQALNKGLLRRVLWQRYRLSKMARIEGCDLLFVPGGSFSGNFYPVVSMSQNLLPFEWLELRRYGFSFFTIKLILLRWIQTNTFRSSDGIIFLTEYARKTVLLATGALKAEYKIIPHGLNQRFLNSPKPQRSIDECSDENPFRVLYVSIIDYYKHQSVVVEAIAAIRRAGIPVVLDLIGPAFPPALKCLNEAIDRHAINQPWVFYHGAVQFDELHLRYAEADLALFASSCENLPNILIEMMASGLPIACSNRGPMPEILGPDGVYFDPEQAKDIAKALLSLISSVYLRNRVANINYQNSLKYSWRKCAIDTFNFLSHIEKQSKKGIHVQK